MEIKNSLVWLGIIVAILATSFFVLNPGPKVTGNVVNAYSGDAQMVKLSVIGGQYVMSPSVLKSGVPVRIEADMSSVQGCARSIVISAFNIRKNLREGNNIIEFTPDKSGTFNIACSMNMYKETFKVLESEGTASGYVEKSLPASHSCSSSGSGGCGCGG